MKKPIAVDRAFRWVISDESPAVKALALEQLLGHPSDDREVVASRALAMDLPLISSILNALGESGRFYDAKIERKYGPLTARSGYLPKYKATTWQAIFLAQMGAEPGDERVVRLCKGILDENYLPHRRTLGLKFEFKGKAREETPPCFAANMAYSLSRLGFAKDARVRETLDWILKYQRFDDGEWHTPKEWPYRGRDDRCFGSHSCFIGVTQSFRAIAGIPESERTLAERQFLERAVEYVLAHRLFERSKAPGVPIKSWMGRLSFPNTYAGDFLSTLEVLSWLNVRGPSVDYCLDHLMSKMLPDGRFPLEDGVRRSALHFVPEKKGQPSRWVTLKALSVLKRYGLIGIESRVSSS